MRKTDCFEREFLIRLAPVWLAARYRIMGGTLRAQDHWPKSDLAFDLLGCHDYGWEMRLLCEERLAASRRPA